jgi:hypothetical protein
MTIRSLFAAPLVLLAAACASGYAQDEAAQLSWSADTLLVKPVLLRDLSDSSFGGDPLLRPLAVRWSAGHAFVADVGADRVAVLDSGARVVRWIGLHGRGPGELYGVGHLAVRDGRIFVGEALNGRVSEFTTSGRFVRAYVSPYAAGALSLTAHDVVSAARSHTHYATRLVTDGQPPLALRRMLLRQREQQEQHEPRDRWVALPGHDLIASDSASTWVFDQASARLCRYDHPRSAGSCSELPAPLLARLREYRDNRVTSLEAATHQHVAAAPLAKDMMRVGAWLALLLPLPEIPILLIDTDDGTLTPVRLAEDSLPGWARSARSFAWDGRGFVFVSDEGIGRFHLSRRLVTENP